MNNFNVEALRNGESNHCVSADAQKVDISSPNPLEQADPAQLIASIKALRRQCQAFRLRAKEAEEKLEKFTNIATGRIADMRARVIELEAKVAAIRAGMIDIDAWILLDLSAVTFRDDGSLEGLNEAIEAFRYDRPIYFKGGSN